MRKNRKGFMLIPALIVAFTIASGIGTCWQAFESHIANKLTEKNQTQTTTPIAPLDKSLQK